MGSSQQFITNNGAIIGSEGEMEKATAFYIPTDLPANAKVAKVIKEI